MNDNPHNCPFCNLKSDERILFETEHAYVLCDARPVVIGHVLAVSKSHTPSVFDLDPLQRNHLRLVQQEASARIFERMVEPGAYEHGRSMLCRFHETINQGHFHAHVHILPASFDLISSAGFETVGNVMPDSSAIQDGVRYLYQEMGQLPVGSWATGGFPVQRHFVRVEFQRHLEKNNLPWSSLTAHPDDHDDNIDATFSLLNKPVSSPFLFFVVICDDLNLTDSLFLKAKSIAPFQVFRSKDTCKDDVDSLSKETGGLLFANSDDLLLIGQPSSKVFLLSEKQTGISNEIGPKTVIYGTPTIRDWVDFQITTDGLSDEQILALIFAAKDLRSGQ